MIRYNLIANVGGRVWANVLNIILVPVYIRLLGIEAYGLVGIFATLQTLVGLLDMGLGPTIVRELARRSVGDRRTTQRDIVRSIEVIYWVVAIVSGILVASIAPLLATHWIQAKALSTAAVTAALTWMGIAITVQFPTAFYNSGLIGLERQVLGNVVQAASATVRAIGAIATLFLVSRTITAFLIWQMIASGATTIATGIALWRSLEPSPRRPRFSLGLLREVSGYTAGTTAVGVANTLFLYADKVVLSRTLPLSAFGYYVLAQSVAGVLWSVVTPVSAAVFPRFAQLFSVGDDEAATTLYHRACQAIAVLLMPPSLVLIFFSYEVLAVWTRDVNVAHNTALVVSACAGGMLFAGIADVPHYIRLAYGWIKLSLNARAVLLLILVPVLALSAKKYGVRGAGAAWCIVNFLFLAATAIPMHRRLFRRELGRWLGRDVLLPLAAAGIVGFAFRIALPAEASAFVRVLACGSAGALMFVAVLLTATDLRPSVVDAALRVQRRWFR